MSVFNNIYSSLSPILHKKEVYGQTDKKLLNAAGTLGTIGGAAIMTDKSVGSQALGGAMMGFGTAGPLGALLGLGAGLVGGALNKSRKDTYDRLVYDNMISQKTVQPSYYAKAGGIIMPLGEEELVRVQAQKGEVIALPTGAIVDVHSTKKHKDMKKSDITDYVPIMSLMGDEETKIKLEDAEKMVLGADPGVYKEYNDGKKQPFREIKMSDALGKKKEFTTAEGLRMIKKNIPIPEDLERDVYNPFARETARENYITRGKFISGLMELASKKNKLLRKQLESLSNG